MSRSVVTSHMTLLGLIEGWPLPPHLCHSYSVLDRSLSLCGRAQAFQGAHARKVWELDLGRGLLTTCCGANMPRE